VKKLPEPRLRKLMDLIKDKIRLPQKDIPTYEYMFVAPEFQDVSIFKKPYNKVPTSVKPDEVYKRIEE
jgi:hypothetical protein